MATYNFLPLVEYDPDPSGGSLANRPPFIGAVKFNGSYIDCPQGIELDLKSGNSLGLAWAESSATSPNLDVASKYLKYRKGNLVQHSSFNLFGSQHSTSNYYIGVLSPTHYKSEGVGDEYPLIATNPARGSITSTSWPEGTFTWNGSSYTSYIPQAHYLIVHIDGNTRYDLNGIEKKEYSDQAIAFAENHPELMPEFKVGSKLASMSTLSQGTHKFKAVHTGQSGYTNSNGDNYPYMILLISEPFYIYGKVDEGDDSNPLGISTTLDSDNPDTSGLSESEVTRFNTGDKIVGCYAYSSYKTLRNFITRVSSGNFRQGYTTDLWGYINAGFGIPFTQIATGKDAGINAFYSTLYSSWGAWSDGTGVHVIAQLLKAPFYGQWLDGNIPDMTFTLTGNINVKSTGSKTFTITSSMWKDEPTLRDEAGGQEWYYPPASNLGKYLWATVEISKTGTGTITCTCPDLGGIHRRWDPDALNYTYPDNTQFTRTATISSL